MESPHARLWQGKVPSKQERDLYKNLQPILKTPHTVPIPATRNNRFRVDDPLFRELPENVKADVLQYVGEYYKCSPSQASIKRSIMKMDAKPCFEYKQHEYWERTVEAVEAIWRFRFEEYHLMSLDEVFPDLELRAAAGVPWRLCGLKTKGDCLKNKEVMTSILDLDVNEAPPVWSVSGKTEWMGIEDLDIDKIRTFIIPPFQLLLWSSMLYKSQSELMKEFWWSAYGFNPYKGGVNRMAEELIRDAFWFLMYDVKGWDRILPLMEQIHELRKESVPDFVYHIAEWVSANTARSYLLFPDGLIVRKEVGNNSGSGTTTGDNILGHCYILYLVLMDLFDGDQAIVEEIMAQLFGDDNIMSIPKPEGKTAEDIENTFRRVFAMFGLELDPFKISETLEGMEFLGFQFSKTEEGWIPRYNLGRIAASFCYEIEKHEDDALVSKAWTLTIMSAGSGREVYEHFAKALAWILYKQKDNEDPVISSYVQVGVPTFEECMGFYTGNELTTIEDESLFDYNYLSEVGRHKIDNIFNGSESSETRKTKTGEKSQARRKANGQVNHSPRNSRCR